MLLLMLMIYELKLFTLLQPVVLDKSIQQNCVSALCSCSLDSLVVVYTSSVLYISFLASFNTHLKNRDVQDVQGKTQSAENSPDKILCHSEKNV